MATMSELFGGVLGYGSYGPAPQGDSWWGPALALVFGLPWIVGIAWFWCRFRRNDDPAPSMADVARRKLPLR